MTDTAPTPHRVTLGDRSIAYRRAGSGPPLLLLHGFSHDSRVWRPQLRSLAEEFSVIAWDAPGAGLSDDPMESCSFDDWADSLAGFMDAIEIPASHLVGLSWGGVLAQVMAHRHPARVRSLVLADTYAGWRGSLPAPMPAERLAACLADSRLPPAEFVARYLPGMFSASPPADAVDELATIMADVHPLGFRLMATALAEADTTGFLPTLTVPTLLVWGDADVRSPIGIADQFRGAIPAAALVEIHGAGHVSNLERPEEFTAAVRTFCSDPKSSAMR